MSIIGQNILAGAAGAGGAYTIDQSLRFEDADAAYSTNFGSLTNIQADANSDSCDLEILIASV